MASIWLGTAQMPKLSLQKPNENFEPDCPAKIKPLTNLCTAHALKPEVQQTNPKSQPNKQCNEHPNIQNMNPTRNTNTSNNSKTRNHQTSYSATTHSSSLLLLTSVQTRLISVRIVCMWPDIAWENPSMIFGNNGFGHFSNVFSRSHTMTQYHPGIVRVVFETPLGYSDLSKDGTKSDSCMAIFDAGL